MPDINEYRTKIEAIKQRLEGSNGEDGDDIGELKQRLDTVRASLQRKQEIIDENKGEIERLREENGQLSAMLGDALAALEAQSQGGIKEIVHSIDTEFADLLSENEAATDSQVDGQTDEQTDEQTGGRREPTTEDTASQEAETTDDKWEPEKGSAPALQRIMGRVRR
jgi:DNA repair exonuclease SbcCD ATPase subunit